MKRGKDAVSIRLTDQQSRVLIEVGDGRIERVAGPDGWEYRRGGAMMDRTEVGVLNRVLDMRPRLIHTPEPSLNGPVGGLLSLTATGQQLVTQGKR